jgi:hypothetical protein
VQGDAIQVVTSAIRDVLAAALSVPTGDIYVGPLNDPQAAGRRASLFLHRVSVNAELRNCTHYVTTADGSAIVHDRSLPLDLRYLLTAGDEESGGELSALGTLGLAMQALDGEPNLVGVPVQGEVVRITVEPMTSEDMSRIWSLFPSANYRTSVCYLASPVWIDPKVAATAGPPVVHEIYRVGQVPA